MVGTGRSVQPAHQPEPLVARFVTAQSTHFTAERAFGLGLLMLDQVLETYDVRCPKRVQANPLTRRALDPDDPTLPAYLDVNGGGIMHHAERPVGPVAAAKNCPSYGPLSVVARGGGCTAWSSMGRFGWRLSTRV